MTTGKLDHLPSLPESKARCSRHTREKLTLPAVERTGIPDSLRQLTKQTYINLAEVELSP
ncbi:hypothetical protein H6F44_20065, partial [Pseudanabaena sp. FACHB-1277]|nr:hypothetical protein [Pseudanabaena cinerea FACHB-1277]